MYSKRFFDGFEKSQKNINIFTQEEAIARGMDPTLLTKLSKVAIDAKKDPIKTLRLSLGKAKSTGDDVFDPFFESRLFHRPKGQEYYTTPEIRNALLETKAGFDTLFDVPFYKTLMTLKAGAQIGKTVLSPMTQVRNVSTASFFPLMSGLI